MKKIILFLFISMSLNSFAQVLNLSEANSWLRNGTVIGLNGVKIDSAKMINDTLGFYVDGKLFSFAHLGTSVSVNFDSVVTVGPVYGDYTTIQGGITAANPGDIVFIYPAYYQENNIALTDKINIIGLGKVIVESINSNYVFVADDDTVELHNLTIRGSNTLDLKGNSVISIYNTDIKPKPADEDNWYAKLSLTENAKLFAYNSSLINTSSETYPSIITDNAELNWNGGQIFADALYFYEHSKFNIDVAKYACHYNRVSSAIILGQLNSFSSAITGTDPSWSDTTDADYSNWVASNDSCTVQGILHISDASEFYSGITIRRKSKFILQNTYLINDSTTKTYISATGRAEGHIYNSTLNRINGNTGNYRFIVNNSTIRYDCDLDPSGDTNNVDNTAYWPTYPEGSHCIEASRFYNTDLIPTFDIRNSIIEYMGDDVLNNLPLDEALKEMEIAPGWTRNQTTDIDATSIAGSSDWATSQSYTAGEYYYHSNRLFRVVSNHTSGTFQTDLDDNKIKLFLAAWKDQDGYYGSYYYHKTNGWVNMHHLGPWHGGKYRNRGNPVVGYFCNFYMDNVRIRRYNSMYSWKNTGITEAVYGTSAYPSVITNYANRVLNLNDVTCENIGRGTGASSSDLYYNYLEDKLFYKSFSFNNMTFKSETSCRGFSLDLSEFIDQDSSICKIGQMTFNIPKGTTENYYGNLFYIDPKSGWTSNATLEAIVVDEDAGSILFGDSYTRGDLEIGKNTRVGAELFKSARPITMQQQGVANDSCLIRFDFVEDNTVSTFDWTFIDFYIYSHIQYTANNFTGLMRVQVAITGTGAGAATGITKEVILNNPGGGWYPPAEANLVYWDSGLDYLELMLDAHSSATVDTKLYLEILDCKNISSITMTLQ